MEMSTQNNRLAKAIFKEQSNKAIQFELQFSTSFIRDTPDVTDVNREAINYTRKIVPPVVIRRKALRITIYDVLLSTRSSLAE